jgi:hypothetical protein
MVRLTDDLVVTANAYGYKLMRDMHQVDKEGKAVFQPIGYHSTLRSAVRGALEYVNRKGIEENYMTISEAIVFLNNNRRMFEDVLKKAIKEDMDAEDTASDTE